MERDFVLHTLPKYIKQESLDCLILEDGTDRLSRNVVNRLPIYTAYNPRRMNISREFIDGNLTD
jgi:hypothetical protein